MILTKHWQQRMGINPPFQHSFTPFLQLDVYGFSRHSPASFPLLVFLYPARPRQSSIVHSTSYRAPRFYYRFDLSVNSQTVGSPISFPFRGVQHNSHLQLVKSSFPQNGNRSPEVIRIHPVKTPFANVEGNVADNKKGVDAIHESPLQSTVPEIHLKLPGRQEYEGNEDAGTQPVAMEHSRMLITGKPGTVFSFSPVMRTLHMVSHQNRCFVNREPGEPGYEKLSITHKHKNESFDRQEAKVTGNSIAPLLQHSGTLQHSRFKSTGDKASEKAGALRLYYLNPKQTGQTVPEKIVPGAVAFAQEGNPVVNGLDKQVDNMAKTNPGINLDMDLLTHRLYAMLERKIRAEKEMRGL